MGDYSRSIDCREDKGGAAHHAFSTYDLADQGFILDPVLKGHDRRVIAQQGWEGRCSAFRIVRLYAKQHEITRADVRGIVRRSNPHFEIAEGTAYHESTLPECSQVRSSRNEVDISTGLGEPATEIPTNTAGAEDGNLHGNSWCGSLEGTAL
jgi:hypothetical protein